MRPLKKLYILVILLLVGISQQWERVVVNTERKAGVTHVWGKANIEFSRVKTRLSKKLCGSISRTALQNC